MAGQTTFYKQVAYSAATTETARAQLLTETYSLFFRNNFAMLGAVFGSAFALSMTYDVASNRLWDNMNRGRQWKDIKSKYLEAGGSEDDDE